MMTTDRAGSGTPIRPIRIRPGAYTVGDCTVQRNTSAPGYLGWWVIYGPGWTSDPHRTLTTAVTEAIASQTAHPTRPAPQERARSEHEQAQDNREVHLRRIVAAGPPLLQGDAHQLALALARTLLQKASGAATLLAWRWTHPGVIDRTHEQHLLWRERVLLLGHDDAVIRTAFAVALAEDEAAVRSAATGWSYRSDIAHLQRLQAAGYQPTDWEHDRLAEAITEQERLKATQTQAIPF